MHMETALLWGLAGEGATCVAPATNVALACWPCADAPSTPRRQLACQLLSQERASHAALLFLHNLLKQKLYAKNCPAGMGFAFTSRRSSLPHAEAAMTVSAVR
jgi:hypothetical protein